MARSKNGQAIRESQRTPEKLEQLKELLDEAVAQSDLATWRRGRAVLGYIHGKSVAQMTQELDVSLSAVKKWSLPIRRRVQRPHVPRVFAHVAADVR